MKRKFGSVFSAVAILAISAGAAAVNMKILHANQAKTSVLTIQEAADVTTLPESNVTAPAVLAATTGAAAANDTAVPRSTSAAPNSIPMGKRMGKMAIGSVGGGEDDELGEHRRGPHGPRGAFMPLSPEQMALLRVAALAQVSPTQARDAARGIGDAVVIARVKSAAGQVGVPLSDLAAVTDLPPEHGRGHGGMDDDQEGDDDD